MGVYTISLEEKIERIKKQVHKPVDLNAFESTIVQQNVNCYGYAIGASAAYDGLYRVGLISQLKPVDEAYRSIKELKDLLKADCQVLGLGIEEYQGEELMENEYLIRMLVKMYRPPQIHDFHFLRYEKGTWSEKRFGRKPCFFSKLNLTSYDTFYWHEGGIYKITR